MCGIAGLFDTRGKRDFERALMQRMNESQHHRGPDECGVHVEPGVAFGHKRLSIIDLSTGQQPLWNEDHSVVIVYNGEIYNYQSLIPELTALGHRFRTKSDTEVIVHAWEAWGPACVDRFRGMFAFALWDRNQRTLFLARDRLGVKPLHYAFLPDGSVRVRVRAEGRWLDSSRRLVRRHRSACGGGLFRARLRSGAADDLRRRVASCCRRTR
jgi:asparagine synthase (glutamine-hydrolysing)